MRGCMNERTGKGEGEVGRRGERSECVGGSSMKSEGEREEREGRRGGE